METIQKDTEALLLLKYFSLFQHPLKIEEIVKYAAGSDSIEEIKAYLDELVAEDIIQKNGSFYQLGGTAQWIEKRLTGERNAALLLPKAQKTGSFIARFPFVRFVGISGSLSKGYADDKTDFDFFIITAPNALWIARTLLHLFKKLSFLVGKQHWLCMNYFMDEAHLELEEQNIFTRIELSTLIPVYNKELYYRFLMSNRNNLPNFEHLHLAASRQKNSKQAATAKSNRWWQPLNMFLMRLTDRKWKRKWERKGFPMDDYNLAFKTTPFISKNHPKNTQKRILKQLQQHQS